MKKWALALLCVLLAASVLCGGAAWMMLSPRGVLREDKPEDVMQNAMDSMSREDWRDLYLSECSVDTGEFEDPAKVTGDIFDAAVPGDDFSFRPAPGGNDTLQEYIVSAGGTDLARARLVYGEGRWDLTLTAVNSLSAPTRTLSVTVPEGTALTLNGRSVEERYIAERNIPFPDMTDLELRFKEHPTLVRYEIPGIYEAAELSAVREGGLVELYADGTEWRYTLPEGGRYTFLVEAPAEASVTVNGTLLTDGELAATADYPTRLDIPEELQASLPSFRIYSAGGLYSEPAVSAVLPDGTALVPVTGEGGMFSYTSPPTEHTARYAPNTYVSQGSALSPYITRASGSLYWTVGVATSYDEISSSDYVPLGSDAFLCRGRVVCTTKTKYQTVNFDLNYDMLWVRQGNYWMIRDLAFAKYENTKSSAARFDKIALSCPAPADIAAERDLMALIRKTYDEAK